MRREVALHEVEVADRVEQAGPGGADTSSKYGATISASGAARDPRRDAGRRVRRVGADVDGADREVVGVARESGRGCRPRSALVGQLDTEPDRQAVRRPALGRLADDALALVERREVVGRRAGLEVDVVGDRDLGDAALDGLARRRRRSGRRCRARGRCGGGRRAGRSSPADVVGRPRSPRDEPQLAADRVERRRARGRAASSAWAAVTIVRRRALSRATVGKTTGWANTPSSNSRCAEPARRSPSRPS